MKSNRFSTSINPTLDLKVGCDVAILESASNSEVIVELNGADENLKQFEVYQSNNTIYIQQKNLNNGGINISTNGGVSIISSDGNINISGSSGRVFVNGQEIDLNAKTYNAEKTRIKILAPKCSNLDAKLQGNCVLASKIELHSVYLTIQGSSKAAVIAKTLDLQTHGSSEVKAILTGGELEITTHGSSEVEVQGQWSRATINVSGSGDILTRGDCLGDYKVDASGSGRIVHSGSVAGRKRENKSGSAYISIG